MTPAKKPASARRASPRPQLEVRWTGVWEGFQEAWRAVRMQLPLLPPQVALIAFRDAVVAGRWPRQALLLSVTLHVLFVVMPLPEFLTRPARQTALNTVRIEYDLGPSTSLYLPPISPAPPPAAKRPKRRPSPGGQPAKPVPAQGAVVVQEQTIISDPPQPNHPRQTVVRQFALEKVRVKPRDFQLPNMVIPPAPAPAPAAELDLRRLRLPNAPLDLSGPPRAPRPKRLKSPAELALAQRKIENLYPRLAVPPSSGGGEATAAAPDVNTPIGVPRSGDLTAPGLLALSAQPAPPTPLLQLPETNLRARFVAGPNPGGGSPGGVSGGIPGARGGEGQGPGGIGGAPDGIVMPGILVTPVPQSGIPPGPVIVGPDRGRGEFMPKPPPLPATPALPSRESLLAARTEPPPTRPPQERAQELLQGLSPGMQPSESPYGRRVYTIYINMPNLTSQAGSWVLRFAELGKASSTAAGGAADGYPIEAPIPILKVDPRYPSAARRTGLEGRVLLYGIIRRNGMVDSVAVVGSVHELLDESAVAAFQRWRFEPGRKNGSPVALEVVVEIPFRLAKLF